MSYNNYGQWLTSGHIVIDPDKITGISGTSAAPVITITGSGNAPTTNQSSVNPSSPVGISSTSSAPVGVSTPSTETSYQEGVGITPESSTGTGNVGSGNGSNNGSTGTGSNIYDSARNTVNQNHQLGIDYAEGVKNSAYQRADAAAAEANRRAQNQYQRTVVDSQSAYQRAIGAYGSNAETLASRGLSGSGYGEWLQGNAYATHRGEVQSAAAQRLATQNDAAYKAAEAKAAADDDYAKFLYQNDVDKNNALLDIDEQEAGAAQEKVSGYFSDALDLLNEGKTMAEVEGILGAEAWAALGDKIGQLEAAFNATQRIKAETEGKDAQGQLLSYLELATSGQYTLDDLVAIAKSLGQYDALSAKGADGTSLWDQVTNKVQSVTDKQTVQDMIDNGATAEDIKNSDAYNGLSDTDKGTVDNLITERDEAAKTEQEERQATIDSLVENFVTAKDDEGKPLYTTLAQVESELTKFEYTAADKKEIISAWQKRNVDDSLSDIKNAKFENGQLIIDGEPMTAEDVYAGINNGLFGDSADDVLKTYINKVMSTAGSSTATLADAIFAREQIGYLGNELYKDRGDADELTKFVGEQSGKIKDVFAVSVDFGKDIQKNFGVGTTYTVAGLKFKYVKTVKSEELDQMAEGSGSGNVLIYRNGSYYLKRVTGYGVEWAQLMPIK